MKSIKILYFIGLVIICSCGASKSVKEERVQYYDTGEIKIVFSKINGVKNGITKEFYKDGKLKYEYAYINGKLNGITREFKLNGLMKFEYTYENNTVIRTVEFYEDGTIKNIWEN